MDMSVPHVLIVGGGVAGLATARALRRYGVEARVIERAGAGDRRGLGVYLPGNAVRAIGELGLATQLAERSHRISRQRFLDQAGRKLLEIELADVWGPTGPCVSVSHAALHELLAADVRVDHGTTVTAPRRLSRASSRRLMTAHGASTTWWWEPTVCTRGCGRFPSLRAGRASWGR
jgi:2-polyprenyl-6-methoxyphenol hydroxylase-like FAD-dependent oxidoreductase